MTKKKKIILLVVSLVFTLLLSAVLIYYTGANYPEYNNIMQSEFKIPGLNENFVPQGLAYDSNNSNYFVSGYMSDSSSSRIYYISNNDKTAKYVTLLVDGKPFKGHMGGIAVNSNYIWVASDGNAYRINKTTLLNAEANSEIRIMDYFKTGNGADSITIYNNKLYVGEFYKKNKYETPVNHHIKINENETNRAIAYCYEISSTRDYGVLSTTPSYGISLPDQAQGFDFTSDGKLVVSSSYSLPDSRIRIYNNVLKDENKIEIDLFNKKFKVYTLSSENLEHTITAPCMSEEVVCMNNKVYILYESACNKWKLFTRTRIDSVHSIDLSLLETSGD